MFVLHGSVEASNSCANAAKDRDMHGFTIPELKVFIWLIFYLVLVGVRLEIVLGEAYFQQTSLVEAMSQ